MTNQEIFDAFVRRDIALRRYTRGELTDLLEWLEGQDAEIAVLVRRARNLDRRRELETLLAEIREAREKVFEELDERFRDLTETTATKENHFAVALAASLLALSLHRAGDAIIADIVARRPINGQLFNEWIIGLRADEATRINRAIRLAAIGGATRDETVTQARQALRVTGRNVETFGQSLVTHASASAREEAFDGAPDLIGWRWVSILDGRTSDICRARSGKVYPAGEPHPVPPAHPRCRSSIVPVFAGQGAVREENYGQWLSRQPGEAQNEILGPARAELFRSGRFQLDDFVDEPNGRRLRLVELTD